MADKHPYVSGPGILGKVITHLRKSFPATVTAETLKKLGFAPKNESYILNVLRFLELINQEGKKTEVASTIFNIQDDARFSQEFAKLVKKAYADLFELYGEESWTLGTDPLMSFFRSADETTAIVGKRQAATFQLLAAFSGHGDMPKIKAGAARTAGPATKQTAKKVKTGLKVRPNAALSASGVTAKEPRNLGLTVRIEINLPGDGDQETYDRIFKSIRENLLNE